MTSKEYIENIIKTRGQWNIPDGEYFEMHHIIPRCMGGQGDYEVDGKSLFRRKSKNNNCIWLYPEEHYEVHKLLAIENPDNDGLLWAWYWMHYDKRRKVEISPEEYKVLKQMADYKNKTRFKGKKRDKIIVEKIANSNRGQKRSQDTRKKISDKAKERNKNPKYREMLSKINKGKHLSDESKEKLRISNGTKIMCIETGIIYNSYREASEKLNIYRDGIRKSLATGKPSSGYHWKYID